MIRPALGLLLLLAGCHTGGLAPIKDPPPLRNATLSADYVVRLAGLDEVSGDMQHLRAGDLEQMRGSMALRGEVIYRSVRELHLAGGQVNAFRYVERSHNRELDLEGTIEGVVARVSDAGGETVATLPWSPLHRFGEPTPADLAATGFAPGAEVSFPLYLPWYDTQQVHMTRYTVDGPATFTREDGEQIAAHRIHVTSERPEDPGATYLVDGGGRLLQSTAQLPAEGFKNATHVEMTVTLRAPGQR